MSVADEWDDDRIHAFVDGELDAFTAARLEAACRQDSALDSRVERQRRLRLRLKAGFDPVLDEPVPARLLLAANAPLSATVTPIQAGRPRARAQPMWLGALAASLLIGLGVGWQVPRDNTLPVTATRNGLIATRSLEAALSRELSSNDPTRSGVQVHLSFRARDGTFCRSFSLPGGTDGLACRTMDAWHIQVMGQVPSSPGEDYRQAGSALSAAVLAVIAERQSGDTLDADQERQALGAGWQPPGRALD